MQNKQGLQYYCISKFLTVEVILPTMSKNSTKRDKHWHNIALHVVEWGLHGPFTVFYDWVVKLSIILILIIIIYNYPLKGRWIVVDIYRVGRWGNLYFDLQPQGTLTGKHFGYCILFWCISTRKEQEKRNWYWNQRVKYLPFCVLCD